MTYLRVTRDQRGYETTSLLHTPRPGAPARVLYCYRTAPGVRIGRPALDEDAIRTLEEQYPDIEFDWPHLLEEASAPPIEVDRRVERPRRKLPRLKDGADEEPRRETAGPLAAPGSVAARAEDVVPDTAVDGSGAVDVDRVPAHPAASTANPLLERLVGREIAARLRARHADVTRRLAELPEGSEREAWQRRADALDPDRWTTPEAILEGIGHADRLFDELKREMS